MRNASRSDMKRVVTKTVRDPIHGAIELTPEEERLIDSPLFQRLRSIRCLGLAYNVYPGATHTRFAHSLGVMHLATRIARHLSLSERESRMVRIAGLLHDIGHGPVSHHFESWDKNSWTTSAITKSDISDIIRDAGFKPREIAEVVSGHRQSIVSNIINGTIDADKIDYLIRDSYYTGVGYGNLDSDRLIRTMTVVPSHRNRIGIKGTTVQQFLDFELTRYMMYSYVYFNKSVRIPELVISRILTLLALTEELGLPTTFEEFAEFDDTFVWSKIRDLYKNRRTSKTVYTLMKWLLERQFPSVFWETKATYRELGDLDKFDRNLITYISNQLDIDDKLLFIESLAVPVSLPVPVQGASEKTIRNLQEQMKRYEGALARGYAPRDKAQEASRIAARIIRDSPKG